MEKQESPTRAELLLQARETATSPGVYLFRGGRGEILYVGKAKNLKNRVSTYFQAGAHESAKTEMLVGQIHRFEVILTETETEALILECTLIKKHKPKFNISLRDDKGFPYIRIQLEDDFPRLEWTRKVRKDGARYFGPFTSAWAARQVLQLLNETFRLRDCADNTFKHRSRPCILHQMGRCTAPCVGKIDQGAYGDSIQEAISVLEGKGDRLIASLKKGMEDASQSEEYEVAAQYRDQLENIRLITETQGALEAGTDRSRDVVGVERRDGEAHAAVLAIRGGKLLSVRHFRLQGMDSEAPDAQVLFDFLAQYYLSVAREGEEEARGRPSEVLVADAPDDPDLIERAFQVAVRVPETEVERQLVRAARSNAAHALEVASKRAEGHGAASLEEVQKKLHLQRLPQRIECYDVSNIQGQDAVASRVVFIDGAADKNLYRRYKIRTVEGANDFAMMKEVLGRRFSSKEEDLPDLVVVDGGKGQLSQAVAILEELQVQGVDVVGLAKARVERAFSEAEVKSSSERVFLPNRRNPVVLPPHTGSFRLLTHVRDEAHRFAVAYHRLLRKKRSLASEG